MRIFLYCLKVWLSSVVVGGVLFYFLDKPTDDSSMTFLGYMIIFCVFALLFSSVSFFLLWAGVAMLANGRLSVNKQRWIATAWGAILAIAPVVLLFGWHQPDWSFLARLCGCYLIPLLAAIWVFKFPQV
jgi:hypothetical protein